MTSLKIVSLTLLATFTMVAPALCASPDDDVKRVTETFYQQYFHDFLVKPAKGNGDARLIKWVNASPYTTARFQRALSSAVLAARKSDPELGLDADPIVNGQDFPDKGYRAGKVTITNDKATVTMEGIGSAGFHISLGLVKAKGQWQIDRIGDIPPRSK